MKLTTFAAAAAAAALSVALGAPMANAADTRSAAASPTMASGCHWSHEWDGYWHSRAHLLCDDGDGYGDSDYGYDYNNYGDHPELRTTHDRGDGRTTYRGYAERGTHFGSAAAPADNSTANRTTTGSAAERGAAASGSAAADRGAAAGGGAVQPRR
jgi:hypothetical protein